MFYRYYIIILYLCETRKSILGRYIWKKKTFQQYSYLEQLYNIILDKTVAYLWGRGLGIKIYLSPWLFFKNNNNKEIYPNISWKKILCTLSVSTSTPKRTFYYLKRVQNYLKITMKRLKRLLPILLKIKVDDITDVPTCKETQEITITIITITKIYQLIMDFLFFTYFSHIFTLFNILLHPTPPPHITHIFKLLNLYVKNTLCYIIHINEVQKKYNIII